MIETIYALCRAGLTLNEISTKLKVSHTDIRDEVFQDQPSWLEGVIEALPAAELQDLIETGCHPRTISEVFNLPEWKVRVYEIVLPEISNFSSRHQRLTTPVGLLDITPGSQGAKDRLAEGIQLVCERCTILEEPRNPVVDGLCLWCRVRMAGWDLLTWHERGCPDLWGDG